jgi:ADP-heptose:LPS heptosyltransferase
MATPVRRLLIYRLGSLGDTIVAIPSYHLIARAFAGAERRLLTNFPVSGKAAPAQAILGDSGLVQGYMSYPVGTRSPVQLLALWWRIVRWRPEVLVYLGPARGVASARRDRWFFRLCGVRRQIGVPLTEDMQACRWDQQNQIREREASRLARNIAELGDAALGDQSSWSLRLSGQERAKAAEVLAPAGERPILCVSFGTKVAVNDWGRERWHECLERLASEYPGLALVLIGAPDERVACDEAVALWKASAGTPSVALNLCGLLTPRESAACLERAVLFMGHDSGPLHLAAAAGTRCVGIFSGRNLPGEWFPYGDRHAILYNRVSCMGCFLSECTVERMRCIRGIAVDEVFAAAQGILQSSLSRRDSGPARGQDGWFERQEGTLHAS